MLEAGIKPSPDKTVLLPKPEFTSPGLLQQARFLLVGFAAAGVELLGSYAGRESYVQAALSDLWQHKWLPGIRKLRDPAQCTDCYKLLVHCVCTKVHHLLRTIPPALTKLHLIPAVRAEARDIIT